ncbi:MAG: hypothetical protein IPO48_09280 [Saprospiraceae bacterium]|nr:hypothetical protein [Saprospiraceae bacterium]
MKDADPAEVEALIGKANTKKVLNLSSNNKIPIMQTKFLVNYSWYHALGQMGPQDESS